jgi:hypothetical protein
VKSQLIEAVTRKMRLSELASSVKVVEMKLMRVMSMIEKMIV